MRWCVLPPAVISAQREEDARQSVGQSRDRTRRMGSGDIRRHCGWCTTAVRSGMVRRRRAKCTHREEAVGGALGGQLLDRDEAKNLCEPIGQRTTTSLLRFYPVSAQEDPLALHCTGGAERTFGNRVVGSHLAKLRQQSKAHLLRVRGGFVQVAAPLENAVQSFKRNLALCADTPAHERLLSGAREPARDTPWGIGGRGPHHSRGRRPTSGLG